jgi:hypothetical protein
VEENLKEIATEAKGLFRPTTRITKFVTSASFVAGLLYVVGFIYLKTYLAFFHIQVELASLSVLNLLLAHRFFVAQHFFVFSGVVQAFLHLRFGRSAIREHPVSAILIAAFPLFALGLAVLLSNWSEAGSPSGFDIDNAGLLLPLGLGWISGILSQLSIKKALQPVKNLRGVALYLVAFCVVLCTVGTYRLFANVVAHHRDTQQQFQRIEVDLSDTKHARCDVLYSDTENIFVRCGEKTMVLRREAFGSFQIIP